MAQNFVLTFLERDLPQDGITIPAQTLLRFWTMLAHYHGQVWNGGSWRARWAFLNRRFAAIWTR